MSEKVPAEGRARENTTATLQTACEGKQSTFLYD